MDVTECDDGSGNFYPCANEHTIHLGDTKWKYLVAHEVGHTVSMKRDDGGDGCQQNTGAPEDGCHGDNSTTNGAAHGTLTKEYLSSAMCEGMADFYSSMVRNTHAANDDCSFSLWYRLDWNEDYKPPFAGSLDTVVGDDYVCYGDPFSGTPDPVGAWDWLEDLVNADDDDDDGIQCTGVLANRSTSYDMERFLWGMLTVEGIPEADLWQIWDDADPHSWTANDGGSADPNCIAPTKVADRMRCAADALYGTEYANQDDHGLDH